MTKNKSGLGKNLSALLGQSALQNLDLTQRSSLFIEQLPLIAISPGEYQPRRVFDDLSIAELAKSIQNQGVLQPIVVRALQDDGYEIIAGERRWRACQLAGLSHIPAVVRQVNHETAIALALIENVQREDLSVLEQARGMQRLLTEFALTHQQIAEILSKSRAAVSNILRLLNLTKEVQEFLENGQLDMGHARCLLPLAANEQTQIAQQIVEKSLSVREAERLVANMKQQKPLSKKAASLPKAYQMRLDSLAQHLQIKVNLKASSAQQGTLMIPYRDLQDLDQILKRIMLGKDD